MTMKRTTWLAALMLALSACGGGGSEIPAAVEAAGPLAKIFPSKPGETHVVFGGLTFNVRNGEGGPGPNAWSKENVWVDKSGLHLKIANRDGQWSSAEIYTTQALGFGTYTFSIKGHPGEFDDNVVLGLFNYPTADIGPDGTNEIDIEFATWGGAQPQHGNWTVWPAVAGPDPTTHAFDPVHRDFPGSFDFVWHPESITFNAYGRSKPVNPDNLDATWTFAPGKPQALVPQHAMPLHLNLWLFQGKPPTDGKEVEVVIDSISFRPLRQRLH